MNKKIEITKDSLNNGTGIRVVLWFKGCEHHCKGCHNPHTWAPDDGDRIADDIAYTLYDELSKDHVNGITYSGGDPLHPTNRMYAMALIATTKSVFPNKTQWLYTGYLFEDLLKSDDLSIKTILSRIDVLVDGKYEESKKSPDLPWVGSSNQRVIDVKQSMLNDKIILYNG